MLLKFVFAPSKFRAMQIRAMRIRASQGMTVLETFFKIVFFKSLTQNDPRSNLSTSYFYSLTLPDQ